MPSGERDFCAAPDPHFELSLPRRVVRLLSCDCADTNCTTFIVGLTIGGLSVSFLGNGAFQDALLRGGAHDAVDQDGTERFLAVQLSWERWPSDRDRTWLAFSDINPTRDESWHGGCILPALALGNLR